MGERCWRSSLTTLQVALTGDTRATWSGEFFTETPDLSISWKFGVAVYKTFSLDYNDLNVKAANHDALGSDGNLVDKGLQAGTPEVCSILELH